MWIDVLFLILLLWAVFKGLRHGLIIAVVSALAFILGLAAAMKLSATLAGYLGASNTVSIAVNGVGSQSGSLPPNVLNGYSGSANGVVYLQYIYDIPEPASMALFAVGLLALTQLRRRKS